MNWRKIAIGAGVALVGMFGGVAIDQLTQYAAGQDLGTTAGIVVAGLCSIGANVIRKWMTRGGVK